MHSGRTVPPFTGSVQTESWFFMFMGSIKSIQYRGHGLQHDRGESRIDDEVAQAVKAEGVNYSDLATDRAQLSEGKVNGVVWVHGHNDLGFLACIICRRRSRTLNDGMEKGRRLVIDTGDEGVIICELAASSVTEQTSL